MNLVERAKNIVLQPNQEWPVIAGEAADTKSLFVGYAVPLAAIPSIAAWLGLSVIGVSAGILGTYRAPIVGGLGVGHSVLRARPRQRLRAGSHHRRSRAFLRRREEQPSGDEMRRIRAYASVARRHLQSHSRAGHPRAARRAVWPLPALSRAAGADESAEGQGSGLHGCRGALRDRPDDRRQRDRRHLGFSGEGMPRWNRCAYRSAAC